jgi:subtilisin-like proprotein convertase family protein
MSGLSFPSPAPPGPYGTSLAGFNGTNPNGAWSLYVVDNFEVDTGSIAGGWNLDVAAPPAAHKKCKKHKKKHSAESAKKKKCKKKKKKKK